MKNSYGIKLAKKVAIYLVENGQINNYHKEYCGTGFYYDGKSIFYTHFFDAYPVLDLFQSEDNLYGIIKKFDDMLDFIDWLAKQTDSLLSGADFDDEFYRFNQRITKVDLENICK